MLLIKAVKKMGNAAFIDFETEGLNTLEDDVIDGAVILMEYNENFELTKVVDLYSSLNDPGKPITEKVISITNITDDMVKSHKLDWNKFNSICSKADIIIAHNVKFDKAFLRNRGKFKDDKLYACSIDLIEWKEKHEQSCCRLQHLAFEHDIFSERQHRAIDDVKLLIKLLKQPSKGDKNKTYFQELMIKSREQMFIVYAWNAAYEKKEELKKIGFRWNPQHKVWWKSIPESMVEETEEYLKSNVYNKSSGWEVKRQANEE